MTITLVLDVERFQRILTKQPDRYTPQEVIAKALRLAASDIECLGVQSRMYRKHKQEYCTPVFMKIDIDQEGSLLQEEPDKKHQTKHTTYKYTFTP